MKNSIFMAAAAVALITGGAHAAPNLITNGSFETGDFTGWSVTDPSGFTFVAASGYDGITAEDGNFYAALGAVGADGTVSQTFTDTPGVTYEASFWLASDGGTPNDFSVSGPGALSLPTLFNIPAQPFGEFVGFFTGSGLDTITFSERNDPGYLGLDNVSVVSTVPEPAAWATMILGLGLAGAAVRRRKALAAA